MFKKSCFYSVSYFHPIGSVLTPDAAKPVTNLCCGLTCPAGCRRRTSRLGRIRGGRARGGQTAGVVVRARGLRNDEPLVRVDEVGIREVVCLGNVADTNSGTGSNGGESVTRFDDVGARVCGVTYERRGVCCQTARVVVRARWLRDNQLLADRNEVRVRDVVCFGNVADAYSILSGDGGQCVT